MVQGNGPNVKDDCDKKSKLVENKIFQTRQITFTDLVSQCTEFREENSHILKLRSYEFMASSKYCSSTKQR